MKSDCYSALIDACKSDPVLAVFVKFRIENIGHARDWSDGREFEAFADPSPEDVDELIRRIRHEAGLRGYPFHHSRKTARRALEVMGR